MKSLQTNPTPMNPLPVKAEGKRHTTGETPPKSRQFLALLTALSLGLSLCLAVFWLLGARPVPLAHADGIAVTTFADEAGTGSACSLREAIIAANTDSAFGGCSAGSGADIISLAAAGTYVLTIVGSNEDAALSGDLDITDTLAINGVGPETTLIDAGGLGDRVFDIRPGTGPVFISEVTIINGNGNIGGGILHAGTDLTLNTTFVSSNTASNSGGGVYVNSGQVTLSGGKIISNSATNGGGIYIDSGQATLSGGQIVSNTASAGGGVLVDQGSVTLSGTQIVSNTAGFGGGVYVFFGRATLSGGQIVSNTADFGGGVYISINSATFTQTGVSTIAHNTAINGGGVYVNQGNARLSGGQIVSNTASSSGGGVYVNGGHATLSGGQIISNSASIDGGGVYVASANATFTQTGVSTIAHNTASIRGGGVYLFSGQATLSGGQLISNTAINGGGVYVSNSSATFSQTGVSTIAYNTASSSGGGVFVNFGQATLSGGQIVSNTANFGGGVYVSVSSATFTQTGVGIIGYNTASSNGGGVYVGNGQATLSGGQIISNTASSDGGGFYQNGGALSVTSSCIVGNSDTSVVNAAGPTLIATGNWWGEADGPAGLGPGSGDSVSAGVDFSGFLTTPSLICSASAEDIFLPIILKG